MRRLLPLLLLLSLAAPLAPAQARRKASYTYRKSHVWTTAVRFFRVDMGCPITEKDRDDGYFLFEYPDGKQQHPGSVEILEVTEDDVPMVRIVVQIAAMPSYIEQMMLDKLERKLRKEHGEPPAPERPEPPAGDSPAKPPSQGGDKPGEEPGKDGDAAPDDGK